MNIAVIILCNTLNNDLKQMTQNAINSLHDSETEHEFDVFLIESNYNMLEKPMSYENVIYYPIIKDEFNYSKYNNIGMLKIAYEEIYFKHKQYDYVVLVNNDLIFHKGWFSEQLKSFELMKYDSISPLSPGWFLHKHMEPQSVYEGFDVGGSFAGWCLTFTRDAIDKIFPLPEELIFWSADNWIANKMQQLGMKHALVTESKVTHLTSKTLFSVPNKINEYTAGSAEAYRKLIEDESK